MDPFLAIAGGIFLLAVMALIWVTAGEGNVSGGVVGLAVGIVGIGLIVFGYTSFSPPLSVDGAIAYAKERPGVVVDLPIRRSSEGYVAVRPHVVSDLLPEGSAHCRVVSAVRVCHDDVNDRLLLHFDDSSGRDDGVRRIASWEALVEAAMESGGRLEVAIDGDGLPAATEIAVTEDVLLELYGADWRATPACRIVDEVAVCRRDSDSSLVLISESAPDGVQP